MSTRLAPRDRVKTSAKGSAHPVQKRSDPVEDGPNPGLSLALDTSRRELHALARENDELLYARSLLTERVAALELALTKANQFAHHDELTGLPNRRLLLDRFEQASSLAIRHDQGIALLFFDLNEFKSVNDKLGHEAGDTLLKHVATRLKSAIRESDTACRYGGDEFVVLLSEIGHHDDAVEGLRTIRAALAPAYVIGRHSVRMAISDGIAIFPWDAQRFADLVRLADQSMFENKPDQNGKCGGATTLEPWRSAKDRKCALIKHS